MSCGRTIGPFACCSVIKGDCLEYMKLLPDGCVDAVITDPPYGINMARGMGGGGYDGFGNHVKREPRAYAGDWDVKPNSALLLEAVSKGKAAIVWGGNYFSDVLPQCSKWLVWDKQQTMPSYSDAELAWTNLEGIALKMFRYCGAGLMALEKERFHPTQKPVALMQWCIQQLPYWDTAQTILDPFTGSGSSLVAAKKLGRHYLGFEISREYCEIAMKRLAAVEAQPTLFEPKPEQLSLATK